MAAVLAGFLGVIRGVPVYGGDVIEAQTGFGGGMTPARLIEIERGMDGLPWFIVEPAQGHRTQVPLERIGQVIYSGQRPEPHATQPALIKTLADFKDAVTASRVPKSTPKRYEMTQANERRCKMLALPTGDLIRGLLDQGNDPKSAPGASVRTIAFDGLPDGYRVDGVDYSPSHQCWIVKVWHPEFEDVPYGRAIPVEQAVVVHRTIAVEPKD